jgi:hypothetical protein
LQDESEGASKQCANPLLKAFVTRILVRKSFIKVRTRENKQRGKTSLSAPVPTTITNQ